MALSTKMGSKKGKKGGKSPKKKGDKKGKKGPKLPKILEGLHPSEMTKPQLMAFIKRLLAEVEEEKKERNLFLLEKQKLFSMWNLTMDRLKLLKDENSKSLAQLEKSKTVKGKEDSIQSQKLRYLKNEQTKNFGIVRLNHLNYMRHISDEIWGIENILRESSIYKRAEIRRQLCAYYEMLRQLHMDHADKLQKMFIVMSKALRSKEIQWERHFETRREENVQAMKEKNQIISTLKNNQLQIITHNHDKVLSDLSTYFNDMSVNNFAVIGSLYNEVDDLKMRNNRIIRDLANAQKNYYKVVKPLERMQRELEEWKHDENFVNQTMKEWEKLKLVLSQKKNCLSNKENLVEVLLQKIEIVKNDRDQVKNEYIHSVMKLQEQLCMKNMLIQLKIKAAHKDLQLLQALNDSKMNNHTSPLKNLYKSHEVRERQVKNGVRAFNEHENEFADCRNVNYVNQDLKEHVNGLKHQNTFKLSQIHSKLYSTFQGRQQNINSHIKYRGVLSKSDKVKVPGPNLGYGFYMVSTPSTPQMSKESVVDCSEEPIPHLPPLAPSKFSIKVECPSSHSCADSRERPLTGVSTRLSMNRISQLPTLHRLESILKKSSFAFPINVNE